MKILKIMDVLPGLYGIYPLSYQDVDAAIVIDRRWLDPDENLLHGFSIAQLINITQSSALGLETCSSFLQDASKPYTIYSSTEKYDFSWNEPKQVISTGIEGYLSILNIEFTVLSILIAMCASMIVIMIFRQDRYQNGTLLARGFGKASLFKLLWVELIIIFLFAILIGVLTGYLFIRPTLRIYTSSFILHPSVWDPPLFTQLWEIGAYSVSIPLLSMLGFVGIFVIQSKKAITDFIANF